jgi:hypothetical protein
MTALAKPATYTVNVQFEDKVAERLRRQAIEHGVPVEDYIASLTLEYVDRMVETDDAWTDQDIAAIETGIEQLRTGRKVHQDVMMDRLKAKYGG